MSHIHAPQQPFRRLILTLIDIQLLTLNQTSIFGPKYCVATKFSLLLLILSLHFRTICLNSWNILHLFNSQEDTLYLNNLKCGYFMVTGDCVYL